MWLLPLLILVGVGAWFLFSTWQENTRLRAELGGGTPTGAPTATVPAAPRPPVAAAGGGRTLDADHQKAMQQVLTSATTTGQTAGIQVIGGDPEASAFADQLAGTFKAAGWNVMRSVVSGMRLKPGVFFFEAAEESPEYVAAARDALKAGGLEAMTAAGYRSYFEEKKKENPAWVGVEIPAGQDFVIVVGPKPPS